MLIPETKNSSRHINDIEIATRNLTQNADKQIKFFESRISLIEEFFRVAILDKNMERRDSTELYNSFLSTQATPQQSTHNELATCFENASVFEKVKFCRCIAGSIPDDDEIYESFLDGDEHCSDEIRGKLAYMKNDFTDSAYEFFSKMFEIKNISYHTSFQSLCEEVDLGFCEYCILPVENSSTGKLMSFYSMIDKYELKIHSVCKVVHPDGENFTKFALLSKFSMFPGILNASSAYLNKRSLEVRITQTSNNDSPLYDVLQAAGACSMKPKRIDSFPLSYNEDLLGYYIIFTMNNPDIKTFLTYLALELPQSYVVGIYSTVN